MNEILYKRLCEAVPADRVLINEPMKKHTTFRIGGPADYFVIPVSWEEAELVISICKEFQTPYYIIGNGSNLLVSDQGYRGVIIQLYKEMSQVEVEGNVGEMKDVLVRVTVLDEDDKIHVIEKDDLELGYRTSIIAKKGYTVLGAEIELREGEKEAIRALMNELKEKRVTKQPLEYPSAGSTFKRPEGYFAGKLVQDAGLRGFRVGDAMVSEKHCGFVINAGEATAAQVDELMKQVSAKVREQFGVTLEPEVKRLGEF